MILPTELHWFDSLRVRLTLSFILFSIIPISVVGYYSYGYLVEALKSSKMSVVNRVADMRHEQLKQVINREIQRSQAFLGSMHTRCGSNSDCFEEALSTFLASEEAVGMTLRMRDAKNLAVVGAPFPIEDAMKFLPGQIAQFSGRASGKERVYRILTEDFRTGLQLEAVYSLKMVQTIFVSHRDLGKSGETFLADNDGFFITRARYASTQGNSYPIHATPMRRCLLDRETSETLDLDYRDVPIIHGFHYVPEIGGGCIMAHIDQMEAFSYLKKIQLGFLAAILSLFALSIVLSMVIAARMTRPLDRLKKVTAEIASGNMGIRAEPKGYSEVTHLAISFNAMADHLAAIYDGLEQKVEERTQSLRLMANVFTNSGEGIIITDAENKVLAVNNAFTQLTGYTEKEVLGRNPKFLSSGKTPAETYREMWKALVKMGEWKGEIWDRHKSGKICLYELSVVTVRNKEERIVNYIGAFTDVTDLRASEAKVRHLAHHDALTGLPNRLLLNDRLQQALVAARREKTHLALIYIDLDEFKPVNDTFGHHAGDLLLKEAARRMQECLRESDTISRVGGDEFIVLLPAVETAQGTAAVAEKIRASLIQPFDIAGHTIRISSSIGIAIHPDNGSDEETLLKHADIAMYHAKKSGRNNVQLYNPGMQKNVC